MADTQRNVKQPWTLDADGDYLCGNIGSHGDGVMTIHLVKTSYDGSITVKARATGSGAPWAAISYVKRHLNGSVADDSTVSTAITDTSIIQIRNAGGMDICLTGASRNTGSMAVTVNKAQ